MNENTPFPKFAFFGTPQIAVWVLEELEKIGALPSLVITNPDAPQGRKLILTPTPVAIWAEGHAIPVIKPESLKEVSVKKALEDHGIKLSIVAAYGKLIPQDILDFPKHKTVNVHPSLLPKLRGASPIRSAILEDMNSTGVTIMMLTPSMDEGPILAQEIIEIPKDKWPMRGRELDELLAKRGGALLAKTMQPWVAGEVIPIEQNANDATYSKKITKEMGLIDLSADPYTNFLKIRAFDGWPGTYFFYEKDGKKIRVKIVDAELKDSVLTITRVIPEGKQEMSYEDFLRG